MPEIANRIKLTLHGASMNIMKIVPTPDLISKCISISICLAITVLG